MPRAQVMWSVLAVCLLTCGCENSTPEAKAPQDDHAGHSHDESGTPGGADAAKQRSERPQLTVLEGVDSWEGTWVFAPTMMRASRFLWLLRLNQDDQGKWTIEDLANEPLMGKITATDVKITDNQIRLEAKVDNPKAQIKTAKISFEGTLKDGRVFGNVTIGEPPQPIPARLIPTDVESLEEYADFRPEPGMQEFDKASREPDPSHGLWRVAKSMPKSPLALDIYGSLFSQIEKWNFSEEEVRAASTDFSTAAEYWGTRLQGQMEIDAGLALGKARKFISLAEEFLDSGEAHSPKGSPFIELKLKTGRVNTRIARGLVNIRGKDDDAAAAASTDLQSLLKDQPYQPELLLSLAEYMQKTKQIDEAISYYLTLVALPGLEQMALGTRLGAPADDQLPHAALAALWKEKHGSPDGLEAALAEAYDRELTAIQAKIREAATELPAADAGNRTLLVEFFTGAACQPCVATDLALETVLADVPKTEAILLTYHQHLPGPDPLTSSDSEGRGKFYNLQGTPSVFMNGAPIEKLGGPFYPAFIEQNYHTLRSPIDFFLKTSTEVTIEPTAEVVEGKLNVKVAVNGVPEDLMSKVRLRLAIAEDKIDFHAPNGVRRHHMVVRTMLGGVGGKAANKNKVLEYSISMPLAVLKSQQMTYLVQFEHGRRLRFPTKPVDLKPLHLVAFVQNDTTREVLQAAATPVLGELEYPEMRFETPGETPESPPSSEGKDPEETSTEKPAAEESSTEKPAT